MISYAEGEKSLNFINKDAQGLCKDLLDRSNKNFVTKKRDYLTHD